MEEEKSNRREVSLTELLFYYISYMCFISFSESMNLPAAIRAERFHPVLLSVETSCYTTRKTLQISISKTVGKRFYSAPF